MSQLLSRLRAGLQAPQVRRARPSYPVPLRHTNHRPALRPQLRAWSLGSYGIAAPCALLMRRLSTASPPASTQPGVGANPPLVRLPPMRRRRAWAGGLPAATNVHPRTWQPVARWREIEMEHLSGTFLVHNGKEQKKVKVSSKMVGHKFGEFSFTRTKPRGGRSTVEA